MKSKINGKGGEGKPRQARNLYGDAFDRRIRSRPFGSTCPLWLCVSVVNFDFYV
jgi:hypothetical protein